MLHFVDRRKNIIRRSGENIAALEVEAALAGHPAIQQVAVIAAPDPIRDEEVMGCFVLNNDFSPSRETAISIQDWCLERLAYFKAPGYVAFVDALPLEQHPPAAIEKQSLFQQYQQGDLAREYADGNNGK